METTQLSKAFEHRSDDNISDNDDNKMSEDLQKFPAIQKISEDSEHSRNDVEHFKIIEDAADSGGERKLGELKVYALCCALVVLYQLYNLNM